MPPENGQPALRLLKALIQFQFDVEIDGGVRTLATQAFQVDAAEWEAWARAEVPGDVKAVVQFTLVLDDGETLTERVAQPVVIEGSQWREYATAQFEQSVREVTAQSES
jgi:hypothetical protein